MEKMGRSICLDTDILVDILRNKKGVVEWISQVEGKNDLCTTIINVFEVYVGAYLSPNPEKKIKDVESMLSKLRIINLSLEKVKVAAHQFAILRQRGSLIDNEDLLIGVTALLDDCILKTNNKKHLQRINGLRLV